MEPRRAYINALAGVVPDHDVHRLFIDWAEGRIEDPRLRKLFMRMAERSGIEHRWSVLPPAPGGRPHNEPGGFYHGAMPPTSTRMQTLCRGSARAGAEGDRQARASRSISTASPISSWRAAPASSRRASTRSSPAGSASTVSSAPWSASWAATRRSRRLRTAYHIVRSEPEARVLAVTVELCSLHLQETQALEPLLAMLQFSDGAAAALVSAEPAGLEMSHLFSCALEDSAGADPVEDRRHRLRDDPVRRGARADPARARRRRGARDALQRLGAGRRSTAGRSMPAAARSSTRSRRGWSCRRARCSPRATCSPATATCLRPP